MATFTHQLIERTQLVQTLRDIADHIEQGNCTEGMFDFNFNDETIPESLRPDSSKTRGMWRLIDEDGKESHSIIGTMDRGTRGNKNSSANGDLRDKKLD